MNKVLFMLPAFLLVCACGSVKPSVVKVVSDKTAFVGETSDSLSGKGEFTVNAANGTVCNGTFDFTKSVSGVGTISCSDKLSGTFAFIADTDEKTDKVKMLKGYGEFKDGQKFTITFGKSSSGERYYRSGSNKKHPIYEGESPAYDGQFEFDI